jgi:hypothetical protein
VFGEERMRKWERAYTTGGEEDFDLNELFDDDEDDEDDD